jgi:hypothetical protein
MKSIPASLILASLLPVWLVLGCAGGNETPATPATPAKPTAAAVPDIYAAGVETVGTEYKAVYWKNGVITHLDSGQYGARATGIAVANGHVYVSGNIGSVTGGYNRATLWTDGTATSLVADDRVSSASSVTVVGQDVYVGGCESARPGVGSFYATAEYWKNGTAVPLVTNTTGGCVSAITASGSDLYVLGSINGLTPIGPNTYANEPIVTVWKNSVPQPLTDGTTYSTSGGLAIANGHVYIAGSLCASFTPNCSVATYWVDGVSTLLAPSPLSQATGVAISGSDIYTSVNLAPPSGSGNIAELGSGSSVKALASDTQSSAYGITSYNGDVYVVGYDYYGPCYWKNGTLTYLGGAQGGNNNSIAVAIVVVPAS